MIDHLKGVFQRPIDRIFRWSSWRLSEEGRLRFLMDLSDEARLRFFRGQSEEVRLRFFEGLSDAARMRLIGGLSENGRLRFFQNLSEDERLQIFISAGQTLGVQSYGCNGSLGFFEGSLFDRGVQAHYLKTGNWESPQQTILQDYLFFDGRGTYVDVGANIGLTVIPLAKIRGISCYAFEPDPRNYDYLRRNIVGNGMEKKVVAFHCALFSEAGKMEFELSSDNAGDHRLRVRPPSENGDNALGEQNRKVVVVDVQTLDNVLNANELEKPLVLKIDTQGAEVRVLQGARRLLESVSCLIIEYWPYGLNRMDDSPASFFAEIKTFPYGRICKPYELIDPKELAQLMPINDVIKELESVWSSGESDLYGDLILSRFSNLSSDRASIRVNS
jgi:FkbM family methyltransferase